MSSFNEHFLEKYFGYRRRYVEHIRSVAPDRGRVAVVSEIARLAFVVFGSSLCALILGFLTGGAIGRSGALSLWPVVFGACALGATLFALLGLRGIWQAFRDARSAC